MNAQGQATGPAEARDALRPEVAVTIGGRGYQLRWDNGALYELQGFKDDASAAGDYRKTLIFIWCLLVQPHPFKSPKELAQHIGLQDMEAWMVHVLEAMRRGQALNGMPGGEDGADDPLSATGPSPDGGSGSVTPSSGH